jgi:L-methionine (R)-S-oxide reductase
MFFEAILEKVAGAVSAEAPREERLARVANLLHEAVPYYNWVGFYLVDPEKPDELILGPFAGEPTEHVRIPFGTGVCGHVARTKKTMVVPDVSKLTNYLACSLQVQSEIVVPLMKDGEFLGELDIDSHARAPFAETDTAFLEEIATIVAPLL